MLHGTRFPIELSMGSRNRLPDERRVLLLKRFIADRLFRCRCASAPEEPVSDEAFQEEYAALIRETVAAAHGKLDREAGAVEHVNAVTE